MAKTVADPKEIFLEITEDYRALFGDDLSGIILYGSAVGNDYLPGISDINFLIILTEEGITHLERAFETMAKWRKRRVAVPLFLTEEYIRTSLDVFPIEYLSMQYRSIVVHGKDILKTISIRPEFLRLQCEREIKGKLLILRESFLQTRGKARSLRTLIGQSLGAFEAIFRALLHLKGQIPSPRKRDILRQACQSYGLDAGLFERLLDVKQDKVRPKDEEIKALFREYIGEIQKLSKQIDTMGG